MYFCLLVPHSISTGLMLPGGFLYHTSMESGLVVEGSVQSFYSAFAQQRTGLFGMPKDRSQFPQQGVTEPQPEMNSLPYADEARLYIEAANAIGLGSFLFNMETGASRYSRLYRDILGFGPDDPIPSPGEKRSPWIFPIDRERVLSAWRRYLRAPDSGLFEEEYRILRPDGAVIWVLEKCQLRWRESPEGKIPTLGTGFLISINATKNVTSRLQVKRERLEAALEASGTGTFRWNISTNKIIFDDFLERLIGFQTDQKLRHISEALALVHPDDKQAVQDALDEVKHKGHPFDVEYRVIRPDGNIVWLLGKGKPILNGDGRPIYMIGACIDISDRKQASERLQKESAARKLDHHRLIAVMEALPVGVFITDAKGKIIRTNAICREIWGNPELPHQPRNYEKFFKGWHVDSGLPVKPQEWGLAKVLKEGFPEFAEEIEIETAQGTRKTIIYHAVSFRDAQGKVFGAVAVNIDITQRREMENRLRYLADLVASSHDSIIGLSLDGTITSWNEGAEHLYGYKKEEVLGQHINILESSLTKDEMQTLLKHIRQGIHIDTQETLRKRKDGRNIWVSFTLSPILDPHGVPTGASIISRDITERKRAEKERALLAVIVETSTDAIISFDLDWRATSWNKGAERLYGYTAEEALGTDVAAKRVVPEDRKEELETLRERLLRGQLPPSFDTVRRTKSGKLIDVSLSYAPIRDEHGHITGIAAIARDITERKRMEEQLQHDAFHDRLTGLANRTLFIDRLNHVIERANRFQENYAVFVLDIDNFKLINDTLGHLAGDALLKGFSQRVQEVLRPVDTLARFGGDEFTLLLEEVSDQDIVIHIAERIQETLKTPFQLDKQEIRVGSSVGIAMGDRHYHNPDEVLRDADLALYEAKRRGKSQYVIFDAHMRHKKAARKHLEIELKTAIEANRISIAYQPIVNLMNNRIVGCEALARWRHSVMGEIVTKEFIEIAEGNGFIDKLDNYVLENAIGSLSKWLQHPAIPKDFYLCVNISAKKFYSQGFCSYLEGLLKSYGVKGKHLRLEVSEELILKRFQIAETILKRLNSIGVLVCLDNFDMGHASLNFLRKLPIDMVKIDCSYAYDLIHNTQNREIMRSILQLAKILNIEPIAEYAETEDQLKQIRNIGFRQAQGYALHQPLQHRDMTKLISGVH